MSMLLSQFISQTPPTVSLPQVYSLHLHLYPALQIGLSVPFFLFHIYIYIYIYVNIQDSFSFSDLLHSVWPSLGSSTSIQMTQFYSFLWVSNIPLYICTISSLSVDRHLGCFHALAFVTSAVMNIGVHFISTVVFSGLRNQSWFPRIEISGSYGN